MSGNKKKIMALAAVSAVLFVLGVMWLCFRPGIPDWVVWEEGVFADATGQYEVALRDKAVRVTYLADVRNDTDVVNNAVTVNDMNDINDVKVENDTSDHNIEKDKNDISVRNNVDSERETSVRTDVNTERDMSVRTDVNTERDMSAMRNESDKNDIRVIWTSPQEVKVQKALSCDIDNDGIDELVLLCWKKGRYGEHKPFWVEKDEAVWSQHLFVYEYQSEKISPKWMSSYLGQDIADVTSNTKAAPDLCLWFRSPDDEMSSWKWDSWGFTRLDTKIAFAVFGDLIAHEPIYRYGLQNDGSFDYLFENVQQFIDGSDVAVINQETPLTDDLSMVSDYPRFGTPVNVGWAVVDAGFDVVTCATNHALDRGAEGVMFTKCFFDNNKVTCLGIQTVDEKEEQPYVVIQRKGVRFALFNFTYGTNGIRIPEENPNMVHLFPGEESQDEKQRFQAHIAQAKSEADFVIVFAHWGTEYAQEPDDFQQRWTQVFLESGVDVVVGTHPHVLQPYELLTADDGHQMLVYYSIGNFISAQPEKRCVKGGIARFTVSLTPAGYQITAYDLQPLAIEWNPGGKYVTTLTDG